IDFLPLGIERYKSGNISWAAWEGKEIANRQALLILQSVDGVYYDVVEEKFYGRYGWRESRIVSKEEVWNRIVDGIKAAVAALYPHYTREEARCGLLPDRLGRHPPTARTPAAGGARRHRRHRSRPGRPGTRPRRRPYRGAARRRAAVGRPVPRRRGARDRKGPCRAALGRVQDAPLDHHRLRTLHRHRHRPLPR